MTTYAIETRQLQKRYGDKLAVADLTLDVPQGEVFGFLGPNGAGKSTSVKMLLGLVRPSGGAAQVLGGSPGDARVMAKVGFLPEHFRFHEWLHAAEFLDLHGRLYGLAPADRARRIPPLLEQVGLADQAKRPLASFSKGMLQRIGLAQALLNEPDLVFLDEPTSALDPFGRMLVRGVIQQLKARGTTVFLNSHLLGEVEATCDRVAFIRQGRVLRTLTLRDLRPEHIQVTLVTGGLPPELLARLAAIAGLAPFDPASATASSVPQGGTALELVASDEACLPQIAQAVVQSGTPLYALNPRSASLEQLFLEIVGSQDSGQ